MMTFPRGRLLLLFLPCLVMLLLFNPIPKAASAQESFTIVIGRDEAFSTCNVHYIDRKSPVNRTSQGHPRILDASSEGGKASAHVYAETFQEGRSEAWVGISFTVRRPLFGKDTGTVEISVSVRYELRVDFNVPGTADYVDAGGSADAIFFVIVGEKATTLDRIHYIHHGNSSSRRGTQVLRRNVTLEAGQTLEVLAQVYAYGDVYRVGYADSYAEVTVEEIRVDFLGKDKGLSHDVLQKVVVGGGVAAAGAAAAFQVFYRGRPPPSYRIEERLMRRREKRLELEEEKRKKLKSKKGGPDLAWKVIVPRRVTGTTPSEAVVDIQNRGRAPAEDVEIRVTPSKEVVMRIRFETIGRLDASKGRKLLFTFNMEEQAKKGIYNLRFDVKSRRTPQQVKICHLRLMKIGLLSPPGKERYAGPLKEWLSGRGYSWNDLANADDFLRLLRYDLLILAPELEALPRWIRNISNFVENGQSLAVVDKVITPERALLAKMLGYKSIQYETFESGDGALTILGEEHPITRGYTTGERVPIGRTWGNPCISDVSTGKILAIQEIVGEKEAKTVPAITVNRYGRGKTLHLNFHAEESTIRIDKILKTAFDWLLFSTEHNLQ